MIGCECLEAHEAGEPDGQGGVEVARKLYNHPRELLAFAGNIVRLAMVTYIILAIGRIVVGWVS